MANPLFNALRGGMRPGTSSTAQPNAPTAPQNAPQITMQDAMRQLRSDTAGTIRQAGYDIPDEYAGDARSAAMYLIQSGQVKGPMMQRIQPMLNMLMGGRS